MNNRRKVATIEVDLVDGRLIVCAIDNANGELADIRNLNCDDTEIRFAATWSSGRTVSYRLQKDDDELVVHFTTSDTARFRKDVNEDGTLRWRSGVLHVAPGHSAGYSISLALRESGRTDHVISFPDELSCGPIDSDDSAMRAAWWASIFDEYDADVDAFWRHLASTSDRLVIWFGRRSADEYAFFLALADRLGDRPYDIIDVTGLQMPVTLPTGEPGLSRPKLAVSYIGEDELAALFDTERAMTSQEKKEAAQSWHKLKSENAPFRIVTDAGLVSAPAEVFDDVLLKHATKEWRKVALVIGETLGETMDPYIQVGDRMLLARVVALVEQGKLLAHGDPWVMRRCEVRLPD
nr:DUF3658 domain-containing protein [Methylobacterium brachythecii]